MIPCAELVYIKDKPNPQVFRVNVDGTKDIVWKCMEVGAKLIYVNRVYAISEPVDQHKITEIKNFS